MVLKPQREYPVRLYALVAVVVMAGGAALLAPEWTIPAQDQSSFWNGVVAFTVLGILCDTSFVRISFANVNSSVAFVPLLASATLFERPWPMAIAGVTCLVVDTFVRRKPLIRVCYNTAQYILTVSIAQTVYEALGGSVSVGASNVEIVPFLGLVVTYFAVNSGSVALAVAFSSGVSIRESWTRVIGSAVLYDIVASGLALLLAFLYVELELRGVALLLVPLFFVRHLYQMNQQLEQKSREQLMFMVKAIEARDPYTSGHSMRVAEYARTMARELGLSAKQVDYIATAALLHDVGKMYEEFVPLLRKEGRLSTEERMLLQSHPVRGAELVNTSAGLRGAVELAVKHHHENYDGSGYPSGLSAEEIPIGARIIMIADTLDAMTTDRPYRRALSLDRVLAELRRHAGIQFDPKLVDLAVNSAAIRRLIEGSTDHVPETPARESGSWGGRRARINAPISLG
jgi:putative nucleotidyltransferase with HDIG domain